MPHHNLLIILLCLSIHLSSLPVRSSAHCLARPHPYLTSTHPSKETPSCIHNLHCTFTALTNSSFNTHRHTASLWGYPTQFRSHPPCKPPHLHPPILILCSPPNMLPHSTTLQTTTNSTSSHLLKHGFVAPQHLPS